MIGGELMKYQLDEPRQLDLPPVARPAVWNLADENAWPRQGQSKSLPSSAMMALEKHNIFPFLVVVPNSTCPNSAPRDQEVGNSALRVVAFYGSAASARHDPQNMSCIPARTQATKNSDLRCHVARDLLRGRHGQRSSCARFFRRGSPGRRLVVDEGQRIKSDKSQNNRVLSSWKIPFRLLLTGTPLQNNARELSQPAAEFLDDDISAQDLEEEYSEITQDKIGELHNVIRPFILRRTKAQVG